MRYLEKPTAEALRLAESRDPGKAFASLMRTLAAAGPVKMTLMDLLPPHDDDGKGLSRPVTEAADAFRAALDGARYPASTSTIVTIDNTKAALKPASWCCAEPVDKSAWATMPPIAIPDRVVGTMSSRVNRESASRSPASSFHPLRARPTPSARTNGPNRATHPQSAKALIPQSNPAAPAPPTISPYRTQSVPAAVVTPER